MGPDQSPWRWTNLPSLILMILSLGIVGAAADLALLEHWEDPWQWTPFVVLGLGLVSVALQAMRPSDTSRGFMRIVMAAFVVSGLLGLWRHYRGNKEFELEIYPGMEGFELFWKSITGATPALAPGSMVLLGLIGLAYTVGRAEVVGSKTS